MSINTSIKRALFISFSLAAVFGVHASAAAEEPADVPLEEIIVTAEKRGERLQDVPIAISAFSQSAVDRLGITGLDTLSREVPSLAFENPYGGEPLVSIRGISTGYGLEPAVSVYIDDTPLDTRTDIFTGSGLIDLFDLERIEVLRGPQGTLFGASSMGGAIRVITAQPDPKQFSSRWEFGVADTQGGTFSYESRGAVNVPLSETLAVRFVATHSSDGGWIDRSLPTDFTNITANEPITRRNENTVQKTSFRLALRWTPDDSWAVTPSFIYQNIGTEGEPAYYPDAGLFVRPHLFTDQGSFNYWISSLKIEKDLGWFNVTSATAYMNKSTRYYWDWSETGQYLASVVGLGNLLTPLPLDVPVTYHQFTEELRATSKNTGHWRWIVGAYFNNTTQTDFETSTSDAFLPLGTSNVFYYDAPVHDHQLAGFGEVTLAPNKHFEVTAGLRAYHFRTTEEITQGGLAGGADLPKTVASKSGVNPKLTATLKLDESVNLYATASKGFRAGGPNAGILSGPCTFGSVYKTTYDPDTVWNYEVGSKASFLDGRASLNAAAFQMNWDKFQGQLSSTCGVFTANIGTARIRGLEFEGSAALNRYLSAQASISYNDAKIQDLSPGLQGAGVGAPGDRIANVPRIQSSLGGELDVPVNSNWIAFARPNWQYVGSAPTSYTYVTAAATRPAYSNVDFSAGARKGGLELSLYVRNLTNSLQIVGINPPLLDGPIYFANRPRTFGMTVRYAN